MKQQRFHYAIYGYRWAPESFHASKGLTKDSMRNVPLTDEERRKVGLLYITKGFDAAAGYVKHVERAHVRQRKSTMTYGFLTKEVPGRFVYCPQLYCRTDAAIGERLYLFKKIRRVLNETEGRVTTSTQCDLDGSYRPTNIQENTVTADFRRPLRLPMGDEIFKDCPEQPYRPWSKAPKKARPHKRRNDAPTR